MEFTFHNSLIFLELVLSTVIFWTELSCWHKSYYKQNKNMAQKTKKMRNTDPTKKTGVNSGAHER
jgi:hypothetical protein